MITPVVAVVYFIIRTNVNHEINTRIAVLEEHTSVQPRFYFAREKDAGSSEIPLAVNS